MLRRGWEGDFELEEIAGSKGAEWISKELPKLKAQGYVRVGKSRFFKKPASVIAKKKGTKGTAAKKAAKKAPAKKKAEAAAAPAPALTSGRKRAKVSHDEFEESEVESENEDNDDGDSDFE